jgi:NADH dehydrogenase FAD-containing subunit
MKIETSALKKRLKSHGGDCLRVVLLGGGLSHIHYIRHKAKSMGFQVEVVLVNSKPQVFYSPVFEEVLTGRLPLADAMIDLRKICTLTGVTFIQSQIEDIDTERKLIKFTDRASLQYDFLSIDDIGEPRAHHPRGFLENGFYARDLMSFFTKLQELEKGLAQMRPHRFRVAVVGGGDRAVSISRHLPERLKKSCAQIHWEIFEKQDSILPSYQTPLRKAVEKELKTKDVLLRTNFLVEDVIESTLVNSHEPKQTFEADILFFTTPTRLPTWVSRSHLPLTSDGYLDTHPHFVLKNHPSILASGDAIGIKSTERDIEDHAQAIDAIVNQQEIRLKKEFQKIKKKDIIFLDGKALHARWGFVKKSEKTFQDYQVLLKKQLEDLRAVKEQKQARVYPAIEENTFVDKLKKRLVLDLSEQEMKNLFSESMKNSYSIAGWFEREYKDVFNDHYLSSYHTGLDLIDQSLIQGGKPQYLRLYVSAPSGMKDVEILSQIIIGAYRSVKDCLQMKIHICGQAMNTVQFSLGAEGPLEQRATPEPMGYIALSRPMGLYALLSQQGKSIWQGEWLSEIWSQLNESHDYFIKNIQQAAPQASVLQLTESGFLNDLVRHVGPEGWKICVNLSQLPRWNGVDEILREQPMDALVERNWQRGYRYWSGRGEAFPESQYLLWEPHLVRPSVCAFIPPKDLDQVAEFFEKSGHPLAFVGYVEQTIQKEQTAYKLSDWSYESRRILLSEEKTLS